MLQRADQRIEELLRFTNDMLDLSLIEEERYDQEEVDCASLIDSLLPELRQQAIKRGITLVCETPKGPLVTTGVRNLLSKGFSYIIENAIKYSHPNGRVLIINSRHNGHIELSVIDEGIGIPEEDIHSIFEPNFRGQLARRHNQSGTGVSMALVEKIITVHRGKIAVKSEVGHGTEVIISLPARILDPDQEVLVEKNRELVPV
jgi:signal transduction histidine kinase